MRSLAFTVSLGPLDFQEGGFGCALGIPREKGDAHEKKNKTKVTHIFILNEKTQRINVGFFCSSCKPVIKKLNYIYYKFV